MNFEIYQSDIKEEYLNAEDYEDLYMEVYSS